MRMGDRLTRNAVRAAKLKGAVAVIGGAGQAAEHSLGPLPRAFGAS